MSSRRVKLPVVGPGRPPPSDRGTADGPDRGTVSVPETGTRPDPARTAAGWEHRFVATGDRVDEMVTLYRELGFEVVADPVRREGVDEDCSSCFSGGLAYRAIYTRRPTPPANPPDEET